MGEIDFADALERELLDRGVDLDRGLLFEVVEDVWRGVGARPDVARLAGELMQEGTALPDRVVKGQV